jgi:hypothetical protein
LIYQREGLHEQAITDFQNAIDRDRFAGALYRVRGQSLLVIGNSDKVLGISTRRSTSTRMPKPGPASAWLIKNPAIAQRRSNPISARSPSIRTARLPKRASPASGGRDICRHKVRLPRASCQRA